MGIAYCRYESNLGNLGYIIEDIGIAITKVINQSGLSGILELLSPEAKAILTQFMCETA